MINTNDLIDALVADARAVRRLRPPVLRATKWLLLPALIFGLLIVGHGLRPDLGVRLHEPDFVLGLAASLATGVLAAIASFMLDLPDRPRGWALLPAPTLILWIVGVGHGCLTQWVAMAPGMHLGETARCFATVLMTSLPLSLAMFAMLRNGAPLQPSSATLMGSLAVAAMSASAMSLFHSLDASAMVLLWNFGVAVAIVVLGRSIGPRLLAVGR